MRKNRIIFYFIIFFLFISSFTRVLANESQKTADDNRLNFEVGKKEKLPNVLFSINSNKKNQEEYLNSIKKKLLVKGVVRDLFDIEGWALHFWAQKYTAINKSGKPVFLLIKFWVPASYDSYTILFLRDSDEKWVMKDMVKSFVKFYDSDINYICFQNHNFVSLIDSTGGTGIWYSVYKLYLVENEKLQEVLNCPSEGHRTTWGVPFDVEYKSELPIVVSGEKEMFLKQRLDVNYFAGKCDDVKIDYEKVKLFSKNHIFYYAWDDRDKKFILDTKKSSLNGNTEDALFLMGPSEKFLTSNYNEFKEIVFNADGVEKRWLSCFLKTCKPITSNEKNEVKNLENILSSNKKAD